MLMWSITGQFPAKIVRNPLVQVLSALAILLVAPIMTLEMQESLTMLMRSITGHFPAKIMRNPFVQVLSALAMLRNRIATITQQAVIAPKMIFARKFMRMFSLLRVRVKMRMGYKQRNDDLACMYFSLTNVLTNNVIRDLTTCSHLV